VNRESARIWTARLLIGFAVFTIGFSVGRKSAPMPESFTVVPETTVAEAGHVLVYAAHMTFRCPECTQIEWLTRELLQQEFAQELESGKLVLQVVDYMRDAAFARRYNISSSTVVVTRMDGTGEASFQRLDEVWTKVHNREDFFAYVRTAIQTSLDAI
jgi:hypothetical protein